MLKFLLRAFLVLFVLVLIGCGIAYYEWHRITQFADTPLAVKTEVVVKIPTKLGPKGISEKLAEAGAISDGESFYRYVRYIRRVGGRLKAGEYLFRAGVAQTPDEIIDRLLKGEVLSVKITIPEGLRIDEQAQLFDDARIVKAADFVRLAHDKAFIQSVGVEGTSLEGYLFPDTYLVPKNATPEQVLKLMIDHFRTAWQTAEAQKSPEVTLSQQQAVTLASIVEKETGSPGDRPRIACVFHNRLKKGMKLQTDPTVIYSIILRTGTFDGNIHKSDLETPHPYNTYSVTGLPPGPIANPGLAAFQAALNPMPCKDLYFVARGDGTTAFCPDLACHDANVLKYQINPARHAHAER
jgi:UPF0755 protein